VVEVGEDLRGGRPAAPEEGAAQVGLEGEQPVRSAAEECHVLFGEEVGGLGISLLERRLAPLPEEVVGREETRLAGEEAQAAIASLPGGAGIAELAQGLGREPQGAGAAVGLVGPLECRGAPAKVGERLRQPPKAEEGQTLGVAGPPAEGGLSAGGAGG